MHGILVYLFLAVIQIVSGVEYCDLTVDITNGQRVGSNITLNGVTFTQNDYYSNGTSIIGCICDAKNCVQECCPAGQTLDVLSETLKCVQSTQAQPHQPYRNIVGPQLQHIIHVPDRQICKDEAVKISLDSTEFDFKLGDRGILEWEGMSFHYKNYCLSSVDDHVVAVVCVFPEGDVNNMIYCIGMIISMPFLLATFLVYAILPDRNIHQRALMFYVLTLCISYILLVTINLSPQLAPPWCEIFAYSTLFFFMVSFFWMNIICFDIWYTFSGGRGFVGSKRTSERRRFLFYSAYAWGIPLVHVGLVITMQKVLHANSEHNPRVGVTKCFLADGWPNLWYFYGEAAILVITNMVFFLCTALKIRQVKKETSMLKHGESKRHAYEKDKQKFNLYLKLLFAMGVNWSMEVISWLVNWQTDNKWTEVWYITDFCNAVYGVFIFFIFVFKKKIWKLLQKRYYVFVGKPHLAHTVTSTNTRTSHYSSTNYSTADTALTDRTNGTSGTRPEEVGLRRIT